MPQSRFRNLLLIYYSPLRACESPHGERQQRETPDAEYQELTKAGTVFRTVSAFRSWYDRISLSATHEKVLGNSYIENDLQAWQWRTAKTRLCLRAFSRPVEMLRASPNKMPRFQTFSSYGAYQHGLLDEGSFRVVGA